MTVVFQASNPNKRIVFTREKGYSHQAFLADAWALADSLPESRYLINLCFGRYRFLQAFAAGLFSGRTTLLPPTGHAKVIADIRQRYDETVLVSDQDHGGGINVTRLTKIRDVELPLAVLADDRIAAIAFTSGSTGKSAPHQKPWGTLAGTARLLARRFGFTDGGANIIATVPSQHMYGLEMTILMALQSQCSIFDGQPFYPRDLATALNLNPHNILVTTPVHLRAMVNSGLDFINIDLIISATAPLSVGLARQSEHRFSCKVHEIYGCTEGGSIATRRTVEGPEWKLLDGMAMQAGQVGIELTAPHLPGNVQLEDMIELTLDGFLLVGRNQDTLNVGGKRYSLGELNLRLSEIEDVSDAIAFIPPDEQTVERPVAFVVTKLSAREVVRRLAKSVDQAFIPRPIYHVNRIPRNETGKVQRETLLSLYRKYSA